MRNIRILCYGDSNTWGYISGSDHQRYGNDERWTKILESNLGNNFEVIEEGLNSRTLISDDTRPNREGRNGYQYLIPCLDSHDPIDLVVIMLGTNELKTIYNKTAEEIGELFEKYFIEVILNRKSQISDSYPKILIIAPPVINQFGDYIKNDNNYEGAVEKSKELNNIYKNIAKKHNCYFLSNEGLETGVDGIHLDKNSHKKLATLLQIKIKEIFK